MGYFEIGGGSEDAEGGDGLGKDYRMKIFTMSLHYKQIDIDKFN